MEIIKGCGGISTVPHVCVTGVVYVKQSSEKETLCVAIYFLFYLKTSQLIFIPIG